jgi:F-type H+-transporting ATPase subunit alpha
MLSYIRTEHSGILTTIRETKALGDAPKAELKAALDTFGRQFA